jgi:AAA ATPase domain/Adenylate and Guanylate cyclase catalytic domain
VPHQAPSRTVWKMWRRWASQAAWKGGGTWGLASQKTSTVGCMAQTNATEESPCASVRRSSQRGRVDCRTLSQRRHQQPTPHTLAPATDLPVRIGLHSGLALVGHLGHGPHEFYTAMGEPTTRATRLQHRAAPGTILMSAETYQLARGEVRVELWGTFDGDEWATAVPVYAVRGLSQHPLDRLAPRPLVWSPFVGRARELALLHDCLARARAGHGQMVALVRDPGMGKSRLLAEIRRSFPASPMTWCHSPGSVQRCRNPARLRSYGTWSCGQRSGSPWSWWWRTCTGSMPPRMLGSHH